MRLRRGRDRRGRQRRRRLSRRRPRRQAPADRQPLRHRAQRRQVRRPARHPGADGLRARADARRPRLPFGLEVVGFAEEEGQRYKAAFLGSGALTGQFDPAWLDQKDADGVTMREAMERAGPVTDDIPKLQARRRRRYLGFVEAHIEQGPVLNELDLPLGIVTSINGSVRYVGEMHRHGEPRRHHADGPPPRRRRGRRRAGAASSSSAPAARADLVGTVGMLRGAERLDQRRSRALHVQPRHPRDDRRGARRLRRRRAGRARRASASGAACASRSRRRCAPPPRPAPRPGSALGARGRRARACRCTACRAAPATTR